MASEGVAAERASGNRTMASGFLWVASAPSPVEVERLESSFPDVIQLPEAELEAERAGWRSSAIIARSYSKWVPAEAFIREFRRAGVQGEISPISLAFRCHIFRFELPEACELVLNRPWVVNGQVIGMEPWKSDFIPAEDAIPSALVWVRLPSLPMEFWKVSFLGMIMGPAGEFMCADSSTLAKSRGGFARVCIRVDLRRSLRPGTRIQGSSSPFWQQFAYESLDGICACCGSIHLVGPCSQSSCSVEDGTEAPPAFGPWIAALRQRRDGPEGMTKERRKTAQGPSTGNAGSDTSVLKANGERRSGVSDPEGWLSPTKIARRRVPVMSLVRKTPVNGKGHTGTENDLGSVPVPGEGASAGPAATKACRLGTVLEGAETSELIQPMLIGNPFAPLGLDPD